MVFRHTSHDISIEKVQDVKSVCVKKCSHFKNVR
jgi:hypothetical protein